MALAADTQIMMSEPIGFNLTAYPVASGKVIYRNALVGLHPVSHYLKPFEGGDIFAGVAYESKSNATGNDADVTCKVITAGDLECSYSGATYADIGRAVFAMDDTNTVATVGHPDGFIGRVIKNSGTNKLMVRLRAVGEKPAKEEGCLDLQYKGQGVFVTGGTAGNGPAGDWQAFSILGVGATQDQAVGGCSLAFDAVAEVAQASIETPAIFDITKGITAEFELNAEAIGDAAALDMDWGIGDVINSTTRADMDNAALTKHARFHMDGSSANILAGSDNNTTDVAEADTGVDNVTTAGSTKKFVIVARPSGLVEFWIDGVQMLTSTTFSVSTSGVFAGFVNLEKTSDDTVAEIVVKRARMAGSRAAA